MKIQYKELIYSKRFIAFLLSLITFITLLSTTEQGAIELATGLTLLSGVYIGGESIRKSIRKTNAQE